MTGRPGPTIACVATTRPDGTFGRTWPTGTMAFWTTLLLGAFLIISAF